MFAKKVKLRLSVMINYKSINFFLFEKHFWNRLCVTNIIFAESIGEVGKDRNETSLKFYHQASLFSISN